MGNGEGKSFLRATISKLENVFVTDTLVTVAKIDTHTQRATFLWPKHDVVKKTRGSLFADHVPKIKTQLQCVIWGGGASLHAGRNGETVAAHT